MESVGLTALRKMRQSAGYSPSAQVPCDRESTQPFGGVPFRPPLPGVYSDY